MKFNLMKNGIDSLKQAQDNIDENYLNDEFESFQLKDGLFNFIHGFEILSKCIISRDNETNIIKSRYIKRYQKAKRKEESLGKKALEIDGGIETITVTRAIDILKDKFNLDDNLANDVKYLVTKRNGLMHYTIEMNEEEREEFVITLRNSIDLSIVYFEGLLWEFKYSFSEHDRSFPFTEFDEWEQKFIDADEEKHENDYIEYLIDEGMKHNK